MKIIIIYVFPSWHDTFPCKKKQKNKNMFIAWLSKNEHCQCSAVWVYRNQTKGHNSKINHDRVMDPTKGNSSHWVTPVYEISKLSFMKCQSHRPKLKFLYTNDTDNNNLDALVITILWLFSSKNSGANKVTIPNLNPQFYFAKK